jgi:hypothetical protein
MELSLCEATTVPERCDYAIDAVQAQHHNGRQGPKAKPEKTFAHVGKDHEEHMADGRRLKTHPSAQFGFPQGEKQQKIEYRPKPYVDRAGVNSGFKPTPSSVVIPRLARVQIAMLSIRPPIAPPVNAPLNFRITIFSTS